MTPKEKAKELMDKFFEFNHNVKWDSDNNEWTHNYDKAKQCALIAVDEVINMFSGVHKKLIEIDMLEGNVEQTATYKFWQEVKQEIEQL